MNTNKDLYKLIYLSLFSAIIVVMTIVPYTGYISFGVTLSITTIHIPVIIGSILLGPSGGFILGLVWGTSNLMKALSSGSPEALIFMNPLISVVPRILVGLFIGILSYYLLNKFKNKNVAFISFGILGTLANTVFVISAIGLFANETIIPASKTILSILKTIVALNGTVEILLAVIIVPVIINAISKNNPGILSRYTKS